MVQGFNHNIKHKGKLYHIQTEDSGRDNPHIITHVFVGGNILATKKTSYADIAKADRLEQIVRELMEEQHKSVLRNLINGVYDNASVPQTEIGEPATQASTGAVVPPAGAKESDPDVTRPAIDTSRAPSVPSKPTEKVSGTPKVAPPKPAPPPPAVAKGNEKSLDEIILSYLADREE